MQGNKKQINILKQNKQTHTYSIQRYLYIVAFNIKRGTASSEIVHYKTNM
jgi:hypothetical protein